MMNDNGDSGVEGVGGGVRGRMGGGGLAPRGGGVPWMVLTRSLLLAPVYQRDGSRTGGSIKGSKACFSSAPVCRASSDSAGP